jgi:RimJ/RimL family protein N-acetyltransferase
MIELQPPDWWHQLPALSTATLQLREVDECDVDALFELLTEPQVSRYISPPPPSPAAFEGFIRWAHRQRRDGNCVCFALVPNGLEQAVGLFQLRALEPTFKIAEWGFAMGSAFWSTGIFQEAATLIIEFAFREMGVHRLEARAVDQNGRGNRALEKLGARGEAVLRNAFGRDYTQFLWAILAEEWRPPVAPTRTPFDAAKVKRQIAQAIANTRVHPAPRGGKPSTEDPFPFFLTDPDTPPDKR